jgi:hypothetical protein
MSQSLQEENYTVHQIWFSIDPNRKPSKTHQTCMKAWQSMYSSYKLWSLPDAISIIKTHFPMFLTFFEDKTLSYPIIKCDVFRILLLYHFGGIYADIDVYPLRRIVFQDPKAKAILTDEWYKSSLLTKTIHNAIMIARTSKNPLWLTMALEILRKYTKGETPKNENEVYTFSGPKFVHSMVSKLRIVEHLGIVVLPYYYFCPFDILPKDSTLTLSSSPTPMISEDSTLVEGVWMYPKVTLDNIQETLSRYPMSYTIFVFQQSLWKS